mgnify:CR=1 FL=1
MKVVVTADPDSIGADIHYGVGMTIVIRIKRS